MGPSSNGRAPRPRRPRTQRGFTLVELMMVVGIVGVLSTVAFPSYQLATMRARKSERDVMVTALVRATQAHVVRHGGYPGGELTALWNPALPAGTYRRPFAAGADGWKDLDVGIEGSLYYSYMVVGRQPAGAPLSVQVSALSDLDGDGTVQTRVVDYELRDGVFVQKSDVFNPANDAGL
jgi:prepilin-type N-terminal cleavage/methylation domain-containing protein